MNRPGLSADLCLKCNICTAACPVAAVTDRFPGPKAVGPQAERYRHPRLEPPDASVNWCSGCGTCSRVCPHGVSVAEMNVQAKARWVERHRPPLRDAFISRPELLGRMGSTLAPLANAALGQPSMRWLLEKGLGVHRHAPMPPFAGKTFRALLPSRCLSRPPHPTPTDPAVIAYFHGCSTNYYEPDLGLKTVGVLERLGVRVVLPPQVCCGLPLQSNGFFAAARRQAGSNIASLRPFYQAGVPIIGTSTSCTLALKHDYRAILEVESAEADALARSTFDVFEFLTHHMRPEVERLAFQPVRAHALYHPPCQLRSHFIGTPALQVLARIPDLRVSVSGSDCCGIAGTYGLKSEKHEVAVAVGQTLFEQAEGMDFVICDSETCRWWIAQHTGLPVLHPIEVVARSLGLAN